MVQVVAVPACVKLAKDLCVQRVRDSITLLAPPGTVIRPLTGDIESSSAILETTISLALEQTMSTASKLVTDQVVHSIKQLFENKLNKAKRVKSMSKKKILFKHMDEQEMPLTKLGEESREDFSIFLQTTLDQVHNTLEQYPLLGKKNPLLVELEELVTAETRHLLAQIVSFIPYVYKNVCHHTTLLRQKKLEEQTVRLVQFTLPAALNALFETLLQLGFSVLLCYRVASPATLALSSLPSRSQCEEYCNMLMVNTTHYSHMTQEQQHPHGSPHSRRNICGDFGDSVLIGRNVGKIGGVGFRPDVLGAILSALQ